MIKLLNPLTLKNLWININIEEKKELKESDENNTKSLENLNNQINYID